MEPINAECRAFLRKISKTGYLEKSEYDNFCLTLVQAYPKMKGGSKKCPHVSKKIYLINCYSTKVTVSSFRSKKL